MGDIVLGKTLKSIAVLCQYLREYISDRRTFFNRYRYRLNPCIQIVLTQSMERLFVSVNSIAEQRESDFDCLIVRLLTLRQFAEHFAFRGKIAAVASASGNRHRSASQRCNITILIYGCNLRVGGSPCKRLVLCIVRSHLRFQCQRLAYFDSLHALRKTDGLDNRIFRICNNIFLNRGVACLVGRGDAEENFCLR